jgi:hypothetical protein
MRALGVIGLVSGYLAGGVAADAHQFPRMDLLSNWHSKHRMALRQEPPRKIHGPPDPDEAQVPLIVTNRCADTIWPGLDWFGTGPGTGGFELGPGQRANLTVGTDWHGRIWGRTNCTVNGNEAVCKTGDCWHTLSCNGAVRTPLRPES